MQKALYHIHYNTNQGGCINGLFRATDDEITYLKEYTLSWTSWSYILREPCTITIDFAKDFDKYVKHIPCVPAVIELFNEIGDIGLNPLDDLPMVLLT